MALCYKVQRKFTEPFSLSGITTMPWLTHLLQTVDFSLNIFIEFSGNFFVKRLSEPVKLCLRDQDSTTASARHK